MAAAVTSATTGATAIVQNGVITNQTTPEQKAEAAKTQEAQNSASAQKDQFLQLLVAQMKYQDPLEPTSNTEYISQYATFSSLEQMQNMSATLTMSRANEMVGKEVVIRHTETAGATQEIQGTVDYVTYENNKAKVFVNGSAYDVDEVYAVLGTGYSEKSELADQFKEAIDKLPSMARLTTDNAKTIENLANTYDQLDNSTKALIGDDYVEKLMEYVTECTKAGWIGNQSSSTNETSKTDDEAKVDETKATEATTPDTNEANEATKTDETDETDETKATEAVTPKTDETDETGADDEGDEDGKTPIVT